ncbi:hypothetical protein D9757_004926 [Collybiopsis confluens]|uniref:Uncharacterized protein n=1 Tax=Collybiopsis confluens TaxID=2823264 RepID=A0A8H5MC49_9AGAR|nr:hypothetical protein D9757_004926 [Collybiopsis confluens]
MDLLHWGDLGKPVWGAAIANKCINPQSCLSDHSRELFFHGQIFQCGLVLLVVKVSDLKPAPNFWDTAIIHTFLSSHHPEVSHVKMPVPNSWSFEAGEHVHGVQGFVPTYLTSTIGTIEEVLDSTCEVSFNGERLNISKHGLIKSFEGGDPVIILNVGAGTFAMNTSASEAMVFLDQRTRSNLTNENHSDFKNLQIHGSYSADSNDEIGPLFEEQFCSFHPNTLVLASSFRSNSSVSNSTPNDPPVSSSNASLRIRASIWIGLQVLITRHTMQNGYRGVISDVQISSRTPSGLSILVSYEAINVPREWLDYGQVRNLNTLRYLHDAHPSGLTDYYRFKRGFYPCYTESEKSLIQSHDTISRIEDMQQQGLDRQKEEVRQLITLDLNPASNQWILDPRWKLSLGDLEFYVQIHHGELANGVDHKVYLAFVNSRLEVRTREGATNTRHRYKVVPTSDICDVPVGQLRTRDRVSARGFDARGLYLIAFAEGEDKKHIGKLVRRITASRDVKNYLVQRVRVISKAGRQGFEESLLEDEPFRISYTSLLLVHMSRTLNDAGNRLMFNLCEHHGGVTMPTDKTDKKNDHSRKKDTSKIQPTYLEGNSYWLGGQTPLPPSSPRNSDEEKSEDKEDLDLEAEPNIGPEDGEEPFNHDVDVLDTEGYGAL